MGVRILRVLAPNPSMYTLEGTNTWVVGEDPSIVIDPGPDEPEHLDEVARAAGNVAAVLVTHDHPDHAPGAPPFAARVGAPLYAFRLKGAEKLKDGTAITAGDVELVAVHTPGHTSDHVSLWFAGERAMFTGDAVVGRGTTLIDPPDGDLAAYLRSLRKMLERDPRTIYPGHGPVVIDGEGKLKEYLAHREERERQVLDALTNGGRTIGQLVETIYAEYPKDVYPLAERSVLAHLLKLEREGRVAKTGKGKEAKYAIHVPKTCERCGRRPAQGKGKLCGPCSLAVLQGR